MTQMTLYKGTKTHKVNDYLVNIKELKRQFFPSGGVKNKSEPKREVNIGLPLVMQLKHNPCLFVILCLLTHHINFTRLIFVIAVLFTACSSQNQMDVGTGKQCGKYTYSLSLQILCAVSPVLIVKRSLWSRVLALVTKQHGSGNCTVSPPNCCSPRNSFST